jgi:hypothetical protein
MRGIRDTVNRLRLGFDAICSSENPFTGSPS